MAGELVHVEIPTDDSQKSRDFWGGLFGWKFEQFPGPVEYHTTQIDDRSGAAIYVEAGKRGMRPYFAVEDIKAGTGKVKELGGEADDAMPVPGMGWFSVCKDAEGNEFGLWQLDESAPDMSG